MAVSLELPLLVIDIQRGGPSTGLPTKTEQSDLLHAMYGRHGEAPVPIVAAMTPSHCFEAAIEAVRIAVKYRTPVFLLSDGYLANGAEPWRLPDVDIAPRPPRRLRHRDQPHRGRRHPGVLALHPRREPGPPLGRPRDPRPRAPHRRSREGGRDRQHLLRPGEPRADGPPPGGQGGRHRPGHPAPRGRRSRRDRWRPCPHPRLGIDLWGHRRRGPPGAGTRPEGGSRPARPPEPVPRQTWVRSSAPTTSVLVPEANLGQLVEDGPGRIPGRRQDPLQGPGHRRSGRPRSRSPSSRCSGSTARPPPRPRRTSPHDRHRLMTDTPRDRHRHHHPQGLDLGPGGPLVPGLRGLLDPHRRPDAHARARGLAGRTPSSSPGSAARPAFPIT